MALCHAFHSVVVYLHRHGQDNPIAVANLLEASQRELWLPGYAQNKVTLTKRPPVFSILSQSVCPSALSANDYGEQSRPHLILGARTN